jgi:hypothetical protein
MSREAMREALRGLRRNAMRASRTGDRGVMISIGLAEPDDEDGVVTPTDEERDDDEERRRRARR